MTSATHNTGHALKLAALAALLLPQPGCNREINLHAYDKAPIAALQAFGPVYELDEDGRIVFLKLENKQLDDEALKQVGKLTGLRRLSLFGSSFPDDSLAHLQELGLLEGLRLVNTTVSDAGLKHLRKVPELRWLGIGKDSKVTASAVKELKAALPKIEVYRRAEPK